MKTVDITWKDLRKHGVNYDYIITLNKKEDGTLERVDHPIRCLNSLFSTLEMMFEDDEIYDIIDMEREIIRYIDVKKALKVCIPHEYSSTYINGSFMEESHPITYACIAQEKTKKNFEVKKSYILSKYKQQLKRKNKELSKYEIEEQASKLARIEYLAFLHKEKTEFLKQRMGYLHAYAYKETYDSIHKNVFFISSERIGWPCKKIAGNPTWIYEINEDIKVSLWSNFCYGKSSAFYIRVFYKGIQLCPYSEFVTYRYAREIDILDYTRKYELKRASWDAAADFVQNFCNRAIADPENFIKNEITYEVKCLVHELAEIVENKETYLRNKFATCPLGISRYINVADLTSFNEQELAYYEMNPNEYEFVFRMEKISGALKFVDSLEQFSGILKFIRRAIVKIEDLNIDLYPELSERIKPIREEVSMLKSKLQKLDKELDDLFKKTDQHYRKIKSIVDKQRMRVLKKQVEAKYYESHPELVELEKSINNLKAERTPIKNSYQLRSNLLSKLENCIQNIESYGILELEKF